MNFGLLTVRCILAQMDGVVFLAQALSCDCQPECAHALLPCSESVHAPWLLSCQDSSLASMPLKHQTASAIPAQLFNSWLVSCNACRLTACHLQAARYQIMIMFLIAATTCIAVVGSVYLAVLNILDRQHRLCSEKILPRAAAGSGVEQWIQGQTVRVSVYTL